MDLEISAYHRKYRPLNINQYIGEGVRDRIKKRFVNENNYPHAIMLYGPLGCGKTSAARLIAKEYHCIDKKDGYACGECYRCKEIEEGLIMEGEQVDGVMEIDIASEGRKDDIGEILNDAKIRPMPPTKYKILILDECHMASPHVQNMLLKIVEEPPEHLVFIFCTTEIDRVLGTLRSRCQFTLEVQKPNIDDLAEKLKEVCIAEGITTSMDALRIIAKKSERIPRKALNSLESIALNNDKHVRIVEVEKEFGSVATEVFISFYKSCNDSNNSIEKLLLFIHDLKENNTSIEKFLTGLIRFTLDCINLKYAINIEDFPKDFVKEAKNFFSMYNAVELDFILQVLEYAVKILSSDETKSELILLTTGLRLGKTKLLNYGLNDSNTEAKKENKISNKKYTDAIKKDEMDSIDKYIDKKSDVSDKLLASVYGYDITEIPNFEISSVEEDGSNVSDEQEKSDDFYKLVKMFSDSD